MHANHNGASKNDRDLIIVHGLAISELGFVDDRGIAFHCCRLGRQRLDLLRHILHHRAGGGESAHGFGKSTAAYFSSALGFGFAVGLFENVNDTVSTSGQASGLHLYTRCDLFGATCTSQSPGGARVPTRTSPGLIGTAGLVGPMLMSPPVWATEWPETMMKAQSVTARK